MLKKLLAKMVPTILRQKKIKSKLNFAPDNGAFYFGMMDFENTPLQLAEEMSPKDLQEFYGGHRKKSAYKDLSRSTQYHLEMSLSLAGDMDAESQRHINASRGLLELMTNRKLPYGDKSLFALYPEAVIFRSQLPAFENRRLNFQDISIDSMGLAHQGMVRVLSGRLSHQNEERLKIHLPDSRRAELEVAGLLSRMGRVTLFPYFAVAREERDNFHSQYNHDFYTITNDGSKVPIQIKTAMSNNTKIYDPQVLLLGRNEILAENQRGDISRMSITSLLKKEEKGKLSYRERGQLQAMSGYVIDRLQEHIETNLQ